MYVQKFSKLYSIIQIHVLRNIKSIINWLSYRGGFGDHSDLAKLSMTMPCCPHRWLSSNSTDWAKLGEGEYSKMSKGNRLAIPAVRQILSKLAKGEKEEEELVEKIEDSCLRFDHDKKGVRSSWIIWNGNEISFPADAERWRIFQCCEAPERSGLQ